MLAPALAPPQTFALPAPPTGDAAAARQLAQALRRCAEQVTSAQRQAHGVLADARTQWVGTASTAAAHPLAELDLKTRSAERSLREAAGRLDDYARALDAARRQHQWSLGKVLTVAAVVAVTTTAVIVTVGAAAPAAASVDAALVTAEVTTTASAVTAATAAAVDSAESVALAVRALRALRPAAAFLKPQVFVTAGLTDLTAYRQVDRTGRLDLGALGKGAAVDLAVGTGVGLAAERATGLLGWLAPHLLERLGPRLAPRGFENLHALDRFSGLLHDGLAGAGFGTAEAALQGSAVTGVKFTTGAAFDLGRLSDLDVALGGEDLLAAAKSAGVKLRGGGTRTGPLSYQDDELAAMGLQELARELSRQAGRKVAFMIYRDLDVARARAVWRDLPR